WGGKRKGAGRPPDLPYWQALRVGMFCEDRSRKEQNKRAHARYETRSRNQAARRLQEEVLQNEERVRRRFVRPPKYELFRAISAPSAALDKLGRLSSAEPKRRLKGTREAIKQEAAKKFGISIQAVDRCWRLARKEEAKLMHDRDQRTKR